MYNVGDLIIYGSEGVCRIEEIGHPDMQSANPDRLYYTLAPLYRSGKIYTPIDTKVFIRAVISHDEARELIEEIPSICINACDSKNLRMLTEHYQESIQTHDCADLIQLIKTVYVKKSEVEEKGKKLGMIDERYMKRAEDLLYGELAVSLGMSKEDVQPYIESLMAEIDENYTKTS